MVKKQHFEQWTCEDFADVCIPVTLQPGGEYKKIIRNMYITKCTEWYYKVNDVLKRQNILSRDIVTGVIAFSIYWLQAKDSQKEERA